ncbi:MAG: uracil-DNA glycosylase [Chloroflexota bacterium]
MGSAEKVNEIRLQIADCTKCKLHISRRNVVPGEGPADSQIMFIGEAPGFYENEQGLPFVGAAGKFLEKLLEEAGMIREQVYITNVVKCRPPSNRDPQEEELNACRGFLEQQIVVINPAVIVTLGRYSMGNYIKKGKISVIHGQPITFKGRLIVPMYHPAAALHQPSLRNILLEDFAKLPGMIMKAEEMHEDDINISAPAQPDNEEDREVKRDNTQQLNLFD